METIKRDLKNLDFAENRIDERNQPGNTHGQIEPAPTSRRLRSDLFASHQMPAQGDSKLSQKVLMQLEERIVTVQKDMEGMQNGLRQVVEQVNEFIRVYQTRFEKVSNAVNSLGSNYQMKMSEIAANFTALSGQNKERKVTEVKLEEMMNRHNAVLRSYESRLQHMQKLLAEKEAQFHLAQATLNETKMEIARMKRM